MTERTRNRLVVIYEGQIAEYCLDDKTVWNVGRPSKDNFPDIEMCSATVSRKHGKFQNMNGVWFYVDNSGVNGTVYNGKHITKNSWGQIKPVLLNDGDIFIFGCGDEPVINADTVWAMFNTGGSDGVWRKADTGGRHIITFKCGDRTITKQDPAVGTVFGNDSGIVIFMGDTIYMTGEISLL